MIFLPALIGAVVGAEAVEPGIIDKKVNQVKEAIQSPAPAEYIERCEIKGDVMICLQADGSFEVSDI